MLMVGFDLGKRKSWIVVEDEDGKIIRDRKVETSAAALIEFFRGLGKCEILLEASTSSEHVARLLTELGHVVHIADPNFGPMYARRNKSLKTDRRDAHALLDALKLHAFRLVARRSDNELLIKTLLTSRTSLVRSRTKLINGTRAAMQRFGIVEDKSRALGYADSVRRDCSNEALREILEPTLCTLDETSRRIAQLDEALMRSELANHPMVAKFEEIPGVGRITALAFIYAISDVKRFDNSAGVAAYLGMVPSINASGDREHRGGITRCGDVVARTLLHDAAMHIMRSNDPRVASLRNWAHDLQQRRGGKKKGGHNIARSALARRLARLMYAMWRDGTDFKPELTAPPKMEGQANAA
jgi:transposase